MRNHYWVLALVVAAAIAARPPSPLRAQLVDRVFTDDSSAGYCFTRDASRSREQFIRENYDIQPLTLRTGQRLTILRAHSACLCGAQNCPVSAYVNQGKTFRLALSAGAIQSHFSQSGTAVVTSHDSALTSFRDTYVFASNRYVSTKSELVNNETGKVKPSVIRLRFAPGTSSAEVSGEAQAGFPDTYVITAARGQLLRVLLDTRNVEVMVARDASSEPIATQSAAWSGRLPATGDYRIIVNGKNETTAHYRLKVSIVNGAPAATATNPYVTPWLLKQRIERCYPRAVAPWFSAAEGDVRIRPTMTSKIQSIGMVHFSAATPHFVFPDNRDLSGGTDVAYSQGLRVAALRFTMEGSYVTVMLAGATAPPFGINTQQVPTSMHGIALGDERSKVEGAIGVARNSQRACDLIRTAYSTIDRTERLDVYYGANRVVGLVYINEP